jgi:hypothetical protein
VKNKPRPPTPGFLTPAAVDKQILFAIKAPNAITRAAMTETDEMVGTHRARFSTVAEPLDDLEKTASSKRTPLTRAADYSKPLMTAHKTWFDDFVLTDTHVAIFGCVAR